MLLHSLTLGAMLVAALAGHSRPALAMDAVNLGTAGNFAILTKAGISTVPASEITGNIGVSPISSGAITGFGLIMDSSDQFATASQVVGKAYAPDFTSPTAGELTTAISDMEAAYTDAAGRPVSSAANLNLLGGLIGGSTFAPGVYGWGTDISITTDITLTGDADKLFIFQTSGNVIVGSGAKVLLAGGAKASNIVWLVAGFVDAGTTSHLEGIFLVATKVAFKAGSSLNGRILAQTAATLISSTITQPEDPAQGP